MSEISRMEINLQCYFSPRPIFPATNFPRDHLSAIPVMCTRVHKTKLFVANTMDLRTQIMMLHAGENTNM